MRSRHQSQADNGSRTANGTQSEILQKRTPGTKAEAGPNSTNHSDKRCGMNGKPNSPAHPKSMLRAESFVHHVPTIAARPMETSPRGQKYAIRQGPHNSAIAAVAKVSTHFKSRLGVMVQGPGIHLGMNSDTCPSFALQAGPSFSAR